MDVYDTQFASEWMESGNQAASTNATSPECR